MFISMSAYLRIIPTEISHFLYYDKILHFLLLGIAAYLGYLALNKRQIQISNRQAANAKPLVEKKQRIS